MTACQTKVQIVISAKNLTDEDVVGKSDPFAQIGERTAGRLVVLGRTETIKDCLAPAFKTSISVDYYFEKKQTMSVDIFDFDKDGSHDPLGAAEFTMGQLMSARNSTLTLKLPRRGEVTLTGLPAGDKQGVLVLAFSGHDLKNMDTFGKTDPFFVLSRVLPTGATQPLFTSKTIQNDLNPRWDPLPPLELAALCSGNLDASTIKFECFDEDVTESEPMGSFLCSVAALTQPSAEFRLVSAKGGEFFGTVRVSRATLTLLPSFLELVKGGLQLNIAFSVDFTGSNLEPTNSRSLHYFHPTQPNGYINAMLAVSDVVQEYDSDRMFPAFGFGAILPGTSDVSHFFHLNLDQNPYLTGMQAVIDTYAATVRKLRFYGPTNFAPSITNVTIGARKAPGVYTILLILTDGAITDLNETITSIVLADDAPLSILIIGIGDAEFDSMAALDGDGAPLRCSTRTTRRDLVQFVAMRDFQGRPKEDIATALLAEIPKQVCKWAQLTGFGGSGAPKVSSFA